MRGNSDRPPVNVHEGKGTYEDMGSGTCPVCGHVCYPGVYEDEEGNLRFDGVWSCTVCKWRYEETD